MKEWRLKKFQGIFSCVCWPSVYLLWKKMSVHILCPFFDQAVCSFIVQLCEFLIYHGDIPLSDIWFANIFSQLVGCLSVLILVSFALQKLFSLMDSYLFIFFVSLVWEDMVFEKILFSSVSKSVLPILSSRSFIVYSFWLVQYTILLACTCYSCIRTMVILVLL